MTLDPLRNVTKKVNVKVGGDLHSLSVSEFPDENCGQLGLERVELE